MAFPLYCLIYNHHNLGHKGITCMSSHSNSFAHFTLRALKMGSVKKIQIQALMQLQIQIQKCTFHLLHTHRRYADLLLPWYRNSREFFIHFRIDFRLADHRESVSSNG